MEECEGMSTALSILLSRFKELPTVCYYDDSCDLAKSVVLRTAWVNDDFLIVSYRFHYRGHKRNLVTDPNSYGVCREHRKSGAESINQLWNLSKSNNRFLSQENLIPFVSLRAIFINIRSCIREYYRKADFDAYNYQEFMQQRWNCSCILCKID